MNIADCLRQRAQQLRDNPDMWVRATPSRPGYMCAMYTAMPSGVVVRAVNQQAAIAMEKWLPRYVAELFPNHKDRTVLNQTRLDLTYFNDAIATDVMDVVVAFEKCAAELD